MINLIYIRAAIKQRTDQELSLERVRDLLFEEGLITRAQAEDENLFFNDYSAYFETEEAAVEMVPLDEILNKEIFYDNEDG